LPGIEFTLCGFCDSGFILVALVDHPQHLLVDSAVLSQLHFVLIYLESELEIDYKVECMGIAIIQF
jgi:hypothetical protein